jgi:hypothetical protein
VDPSQKHTMGSAPIFNLLPTLAAAAAICVCHAFTTLCRCANLSHCQVNAAPLQPTADGMHTCTLLAHQLPRVAWAVARHWSAAAAAGWWLRHQLLQQWARGLQRQQPAEKPSGCCCGSCTSSTCPPSQQNMCVGFANLGMLLLLKRMICRGVSAAVRWYWFCEAIYCNHKRGRNRTVLACLSWCVCAGAMSSKCVVHMRMYHMGGQLRAHCTRGCFCHCCANKCPVGEGTVLSELAVHARNCWREGNEETMTYKKLGVLPCKNERTGCRRHAPYMTAGMRPTSQRHLHNPMAHTNTITHGQRWTQQWRTAGAALGCCSGRLPLSAPRLYNGCRACTSTASSLCLHQLLDEACH